MALQIRRGLDNDRKTRGFDQGELVWATDTEKLYVGRELGTLGGVNVLATSAGTGLKFDNATQTLAINTANLGFSTNDITEGNNNQYFTTAKAKLAAASMLQSGTHTGITFTYDAVTGLMTTVVTGATATVSSDTTPALGGNLNLSSHSITGTGGINITGSAAVSDLAASFVNTAILKNTTGSITITPAGDENVSAITPNFLVQHANANPSFYTTSVVALKTSRGTIASPAALQIGDFLGRYATYLHDGSDFMLGSSINSTVVSNNGTGTNSRPVQLTFSVLDETGGYSRPAVLLPTGLFSSLAIQSRGMGSADIGTFLSRAAGGNTSLLKGALITNTDTNRLQLYNGSSWTNVAVDGAPYVAASCAGSGSYPTPVAGMIVFDSNTSHFFGYDGSTWKQLDN